MIFYQFIDITSILKSKDPSKKNSKFLVQFQVKSIFDPIKNFGVKIMCRSYRINPLSGGMPTLQPVKHTIFDIIFLILKNYE